MSKLQNLFRQSTDSFIGEFGDTVIFISKGVQHSFSVIIDKGTQQDSFSPLNVKQDVVTITIKESDFLQIGTYLNVRVLVDGVEYTISEPPEREDEQFLLIRLRLL
jgi:hypothetical protein